MDRLDQWIVFVALQPLVLGPHKRMLLDGIREEVEINLLSSGFTYSDWEKEALFNS